ncbi:MAG: TonB C-terminal domain-containing protein [Acidobacteria bacterium]|nr:TonB C-terminal domain-containing protein [Acidobacteriota bacterium]
MFLTAQPVEFSRPWTSRALSLALHAAGILALLLAPRGVVAPKAGPTGRALTPLIAPPRALTQNQPNRGKIGKEYNIEALLPRPRIRIPPSPPSTTRPAAPRPSMPAPPPALPEPPQVEVAARIAPPTQQPQIHLQERPPSEKPKLAFENPAAPPPVAAGRIEPPGSSVAEAVRVLARRGASGGIMVGDLGEGIGGIGEAMNLPPSPGKAGSALELLSDPMGVDFRPYLIRILANVRRNWWAVMPESALLGRKGRVGIQFAINRDGGVPKLVIVSPSGADALDRAAVAGISASNPFPPLPSEYKGEQIRLQFTFLYNTR